MPKSAEAFRTISEVAVQIDVPKHVLRFWEGKFTQIKPMKRGGGRRYYRPEDVELLSGIRELLYESGYTIKGVQKLLREQGVDYVKSCAENSDALTTNGAVNSANSPSIPDLAKTAETHAENMSTNALLHSPQSAPTKLAPPKNANGLHVKAKPQDASDILLTVLKDLEYCKKLIESARD